MNTELMEYESEDGVEVESGTAVEILSANGALSAVERAQIDSQVATAKAYPRSVTKALREAETLATLDADTAGSCFYSLPRGRKDIEGPSVRLAEIMSYSWGNLRVDADIVAEDRTHVTAQGTCYDLEKNIAIRVTNKRRITDKHGERYGDDMIGVTQNAAVSIVLRNAIFRVIPQAFTRRVYVAARKASLGKGTMVEKRARALKWFADMDVKADQVFALLGIKGEDDLGEDELIRLRGLVTAIKDGETTVEQVFRRHDVSNGAGELNEALAKPKAGPIEDAPEEPSIAKREALAGIGVKDREAIFERLGIEDAGDDPDAYAAELDKIIAAKEGA